MIEHTDVRVLLFCVFADGIHLAALKEQRFFEAAVTDVQAHILIVAPIFDYDGIDVFPRKKIVLRRNLHVIEDFESSAGDCGILYRYHCDGIQN